MMVRSAFGPKAKNKVSALHPLALLSMDIYAKANRDLQLVKEFKTMDPLHQLRMDFRKSAIGLFLGEVLHKSLGEESSHPELFEFLYAMIQVLELKEKGLGHFHLYFLLQYTRFLGFYPDVIRYEAGNYVDLRSGSFSKLKPVHDDFLAPDEAESWINLAKFSPDQHEEIRLAAHERNRLLQQTMRYLQLHVHGLSTINSLEVLRDVFH
jgi:DNA repair protein RecO (recombination protein O)